MKTEDAVMASRDARLYQCRNALNTLLGMIGKEEPTSADMATARRTLGLLNQTFHEYSAYRTALGKSDE